MFYFALTNDSGTAVLMHVCLLLWERSLRYSNLQEAFTLMQACEPYNDGN